jgi:hypothetical protein
MKKIEECGAFELSGNVESRDTKTRGNFWHHIHLESNKVSVAMKSVNRKVIFNPSGLMNKTEIFTGTVNAGVTKGSKAVKTKRSPGKARHPKNL